MNTVQALLVAGNRPDNGAECRVAPSFEAQHRALVQQRVSEFWNAVQEARLAEYLEPLPQTRLHASQRAFREIGAIRVSNILREGLHKLTRVGAPRPLPLVASEMMRAALAAAEDVCTLVSDYSKTPVRKIVPRMSVYHSWKETHRIY
jgi:hypothetical protein